MSSAPTCFEPSPTPDPELREHLAGAAQSIVSRLIPDPRRRAEHLGQAFLACEEAAREQPEAVRDALGAGELENFLRPSIEASLTGDREERFSGGWLGTYVGPDAREVEAEPHPDTTDRGALEISVQALQRAVALARHEGNDVLLRNLRWYRERLAHKSYDAIARAEGRIPGTVRTGVARARKFVLKIVHELQHAQPAPLNGGAPPEIEPLRKLWFEQDVERLAEELERTRDTHRDDPHWLNLAGLVAADRGQYDRAEEHYRRGLVFADAPSVRGRVLNNLGNLADDRGSPEDAQHYWLRAHHVLPDAPAPLVNLLSAASERRDYASSQHYISEISRLLNTGKLDASEVDYLRRRLGESPKLCWLRDTDVWRQGPARWLRNGVTAVAATAMILIAALFLLVPGIASAETGDSRLRHEVERADLWSPSDARPVLVVAGDRRGDRTRGGDSMGKPVRVWEPAPHGGSLMILSGDSMGRSAGKRGKRGS